MTAVGVASPRAHGQAMTMTAVNAMSAMLSDDPIKKNQMRNVRIATAMTAGTNQAEILSANA